MNSYLPDYVERLIYWTAGHSNILPVTSKCNVKCVFCSNMQNPPGVEAFNLKALRTEQLSDLVALLDPQKPIVIGESATRINEGEPFTHPDIRGILLTIRKSLPHTTIQITTNGSLLNPGQLEFLRNIAPVTIYLSLNSVNQRQRIMNDTHSENAVTAAALLTKYGITWHGSVVAMPHLTGWGDLEETIRYLDHCGAQTIRVFVPGFTRLAPKHLCYPVDMPLLLRQIVNQLSEEVRAPLTIEPPLITGLQPEVAGVIPNSPAGMAGIRRGCVIQAVNEKEAFSRVHAFYMIKKQANPVVTIKSKAGVRKTTMNKAAGESSGLVMEYDIDISLLDALAKAAARRSAEKIVLFASELAVNVLTLAKNKYAFDCNLTVVPVPNLFFGGSIKAAGLLVLPDLIGAISNYLDQHPKPDLLVLPQIAFDPNGRDLLGEHWSEVESLFSIPVEIL